MNILAVDPGLSNGIAYFDSQTRQYVTSLTKQHTELYALFKVKGIDIVVVENFAAERISGYGLHTVRVVGALEGICHLLSIEFVKQQPQQRRAFLDFAKALVSKQGTNASVGDTHHHQADALAHLLAYQYERIRIGVSGDNGLFFTDTKEWILKPLGAK